FVNYDGTPGYSTDASHKDWVDLTTVEVGGQNRSQHGTSTSELAGEVQMDDVTLTGPWSATTAALRHKMTVNEVIPKATIQVCPPNAERTVLKRMVLTNVRVIEARDTSGDNGQMTDRVALDYESITWQIRNPEGVFIGGGWSKKERKPIDPA